MAGRLDRWRRRGHGLRARLCLLPLLLTAALVRPCRAHAGHAVYAEPAATAASLEPQQLVADAARIRAAAAAPGGAALPPAARSVSGARAAGMLSAALTPGAAAKIAARGGWKDVEALQEELRADPYLKLDLVSETLHYACPTPEPLGDGFDFGAAAAASAEGAGAGLAPAADWEARASLLPDPPPLSDAFKLHSRPEATYVLVMDFTGNYFPGPPAGQSTCFNPRITTPAYDIDGDNTTFSDEERRRIIATWLAVSEDYRPYNIDVTTDEQLLPHQRLGVRIAIGGTSRDWYAPGSQMYGGVACMGTFGYEVPGFAFAGNLKANETAMTAKAATPRYMAEVVSHEAGHTFNLRHWGLGSSDWGSNYYRGHPNGVWAPIMGVGYNCSVTQWAKGEYAGASIVQDDLATIASYLGYVADDFGDTTDTAFLLDDQQIASGGLVQGGAIGRTADADVFKFWAGQGTLKLRLDVLGYPSPPYMQGHNWTLLGSNLDAVLMLQFPSGAIQKWEAGATPILSGAWDVQLATEGFHYITIQGTGYGDNATVGFSPYDSMGRYALGVSGSWAPPPLRCLADTYTVSLPAAGKACADGAAVPISALVNASVPVVASPLLPGAVYAGHDVTYTISSAATTMTCSVRVQAVGCQAPACSNVSVQLPGSGTCGGAAVAAAQLYASSAAAAVQPPLPALIKPGSYTFNVSNADGSCLAAVTVRPCAPVCKEAAVKLPQPGGNCSGAAIAASDLVDAQGDAVTFEPPLSQLASPGKTTYTVRKALGGECTANVTVERCGTCAQMNIKVVGSSKSFTRRAWRMSKVTLMVADGNGYPVKGVAVTAEWTQVMAGSGPLMFTALQAKGISSSAKKGAGTLTLRAPAAVPFGDSVVLRLLAASSKKDPACTLPAGAAGAVLATFQCAAKGCQ